MEFRHWLIMLLLAFFALLNPIVAQVEADRTTIAFPTSTKAIPIPQRGGTKIIAARQAGM